VSSLSGEKYNYINAEVLLRSLDEVQPIDLTQ